MKNLILFLTLMLNCCNPVLSQENMKPGFIITLSGDTVHGMIDYRSWDRNPVEILFIHSGPLETYNPESIAGFSVAGESYISESVKVETSPYNLNELKEDPQLHFENVRAFLYCLVEGKKSLYHLKDVRDKDNFYIRTDSGMTLLLQKLYIREVSREDMSDGSYAGGKSLFMENKYYYKTENRTYLGQLSNYLQDCEAIPPMISSVTYDQTSLLKLFQLYNKKCNSTIIVNRGRKAVLQIGIVTGVSLNSLKWGENKTFAFSKTKYGFKPNAVIGFQFDLKLRGNSGKWSINNELLYAPFKVDGFYENYINAERYTRITTKIGSGYFKMNNMIRFRYPLETISIFANAGISSSYGQVKYNDLTTVINNYGDESTEFGMAMRSTDKFELGFNGGLGAMYKKWAFEARWEQGDGMSSLAALQSTTRRLYLLLSYRFTGQGQ